jgi:hypothetical protein
MRLSRIAVPVVLLAGLSAAPHAQETTTTGELITVMCYTGNGAKGRGDDHAACALKCANEGYPLAVLTESGEMYKLIGPLTADKNAAIRDLLSKTVVVKGDIGTEGEAKTVTATSVVPARPSPR